MTRKRFIKRMMADGHSRNTAAAIAASSIKLGLSYEEAWAYNMRFKVGSTVVVVQVYSGGNFAVGDIVKVCQIGDDDGYEKNCYGAISPHDGIKWYLFEDEVAPFTNGDLLRSMSDQSLGEWICSLMTAEGCDTRCPAKALCGPDRKGLVRWMKEETVVKN